MLYILDFDGTIADTAAGIVRTMQATFLECGYQEPQPEAIRATIGLPLSRAIAQLANLPEGEARDIATATYRRLFESIGTVGVTLFPGVRETLQQLHGAGHVLTIATGRGHVSAENFCRDMGILPLLSDIVADEDVVNKKPHAEPVLVLLERQGAEPGDALVVGDTDYDILMGKAAGVKTCGVTYGNHSRERLSAAGADFIIDDFRELLCKARAESDKLVWSGYAEPPPKGALKMNVSVLFNQETFWLSQQRMAELFGVTNADISYHLIQIENNGELHLSDCIKKILIPSEQWDEQGVTQSSSLLE